MPQASSGATWPTRSPIRDTSIAPTCSTSTRVVSPTTSISGRKDAGARVVAVERDRDLADALRRELARRDLADRVVVRRADLGGVAWPDGPYRVVASPPFGLTTMLLARLLDDPGRGPVRADLLLQREVARKRAARPPDSLRSAAWAPWWSFALGERVGRGAFRPVPAVDAAWLTARRRDPPVLPSRLAPGFAETLRPVWVGEAGRSGLRR